AHDQLGAAGPVLVEVHGDQALDHLALALPHAPHVGRRRPRHQPELRRVVNQVRDLCTPDLVLAGQAVDVRAGAADPFPLHHGRPAPRLRKVPRQVFPALPAAQDEVVAVFALRHANLPLRTDRPTLPATYFLWTESGSAATASLAECSVSPPLSQ